MPYLVHTPAGARILLGTFLAILAAEVIATYVGRARDGDPHPLRSFADAFALLHRVVGGSTTHERSTASILFVVSRVGFVAAVAVAALVPASRAFANTWTTLWLGAGIVLAGTALRAWAIVTLGRYFRRIVTIEPGQPLIRRGPYRVLRHPSYAGLLLIAFGLGLELGSWVSAAIALASAFLALLPRIGVEEHALAQTFGVEFAEYKRGRARVLPFVW